MISEGKAAWKTVSFAVAGSTATPGPAVCACGEPHDPLGHLRQGVAVLAQLGGVDEHLRRLDQFNDRALRHRRDRTSS